MRDVITHRGPDDAGHVLSTAQAGLVHRRLSIVDLAAGHQPLSNEDESVWIVFNGEIYNHAEIRPTLEAHGHIYRTRCDTETIVHAYEQWGDACVERFRGMFAFAIWDAKRKRLLLARDRMGIKPLYWTLRRRPPALRIRDQGDPRERPRRAPRPTIARSPSCSARATSRAPRRCSRASTGCCPATCSSSSTAQATTRQWWDVPVGKSASRGRAAVGRRGGRRSSGHGSRTPSARG